MIDPKISELTVSQLQELIRSTVQEAVAEVILEFSAAAEVEDRLQFEADVVDYLRSSMRGGFTQDSAQMAQKLDD